MPISPLKSWKCQHLKEVLPFVRPSDGRTYVHRLIFFWQETYDVVFSLVEAISEYEVLKREIRIFYGGGTHYFQLAERDPNAGCGTIIRRTTTLALEAKIGLPLSYKTCCLI